MEQTKRGWFACLLTYAGAGKEGSVVLSVISVTAGLLPYYCVFRLIEAFAAGGLNEELILTWCGLALPVVSIIALLCIDWRVALASLVTVPFSLICMVLTFQVSGKSFDQYNASNAAMNSTIVEYIEGIEVIKAFGRTGASYDKYAKSITDYRTFVVKWLSSTWVTFKLAFALFPSTLLGTLPMCLWLGSTGAITAGEAGRRLSGGEKQRIAIARMILKNAPVVILDEATAFTDPENEEKIQQSIAALTRGKTLLVIAHRLSTIKNADNLWS